MNEIAKPDDCATSPTRFLGTAKQRVIEIGESAKRIKIHGRKIKVRAGDIVEDKRGMEFVSDGKVWRLLNCTWATPPLGPHFETVQEYEDYLMSRKETEVRRKREKRQARGLAWRVKSWWRAWRRRMKIDRLRSKMAKDLGSRVPVVGVFTAAFLSDEQVLEWDRRRRAAANANRKGEP